MSATEAPNATTVVHRTDSELADVLVVFGITGDLARVMTFHSLYRLEQRGLLDCPIVGVAFEDWTLEQLIQRARDSIVATGEELDEEVFARFSRRLSYHRGDFTDDATYAEIAHAIEDANSPVFYLEVLSLALRHSRRWPCEGRCDGKRKGRRREAVRPRPGFGAGARGRVASVHR